MSEPKTYKRSFGLILPGFTNKPAIQVDQYNGKHRAKFSIRDILRDKIVTVTLWEEVVNAKLPYLRPGSLVVVDGVYSARDKQKTSSLGDSKMHSISVSKVEGCWVQPSAEINIEAGELTIEDSVPDFDSAFGELDEEF
jgi:hypothetical protein